VDPVFAWTVYGTMTVLTLALVGLLGSAVLGLRGSIEGLGARIDRQGE
jgi:hypothetical protein